MNDKQTGQVVSFISALFVLLCFFLPWLEIGALFVKVEISGFQLATGSGPSGVQIPNAPSLWLIFFAMLCVAITAGAAIFKLKISRGLAERTPLILIAGGALSVIILLYQHFDLDAQVNKDLLGMIAGSLIAYKFGAFAALLGGFSVGAGGVLDFLRAKEPAASQPPLP